ncbi:MAG: hypothetical protein Q4F95_15400 [Oscillospiraceae bacterium]|nr:hypothetical protein [Oscillospiraceae bacterium]
MKLSYGQMCIIVLIYRIFIIMSATEPYCAAWMAGSALSLGVQFLIMLPLLSILKRPVEFEFRGKKNIIFSVFFIIWGAVTFRKFISVMHPDQRSSASALISILLLAAVCIYCSGVTLRAAGRCSVIVFGIFIFSLAVLVLGSYSGIKADNFSHVSDTKGIISYAVRDFAQSGELVLLFILCALTREKAAKGFNLYFLIRLIITQATALLGTLVLGRLSYHLEFPFFGICSFSQPFDVQRSDALFVIVFSMVCIVNLTINTLISSEILKNFIKKPQYLTALLMAAGGYILYFLSYDTIIIEFVLVAVFIAASYIIMAAGTSETTNHPEAKKVQE